MEAETEMGVEMEVELAGSGNNDSTMAASTINRILPTKCSGTDSAFVSFFRCLAARRMFGDNAHR